MSITEVFIKVTDVPLSLWKQQGPRWPQMRIPIATRALGMALGVKKQAQEHTPAPCRHLPLPSSATAETMRDQKEEEERDKSKCGRKGQKITGFRHERGA